MNWRVVIIFATLLALALGAGALYFHQRGANNTYCAWHRCSPSYADPARNTAISQWFIYAGVVVIATAVSAIPLLAERRRS